MPDPRPSVDPGGSAELRRVVLLLETAAVLEARARRCGDPAQVAVLVRRAEHRRREAARLRESLAASAPSRAPLPATPAGRAAFRPAIPGGSGWLS